MRLACLLVLLHAAACNQSNDSLSCGSVVTGDNFDTSDRFSGVAPNGQDVAFLLTLTGTTSIKWTTCLPGTDFDTIISLFDASENFINENDDALFQLCELESTRSTLFATLEAVSTSIFLPY